MRFSFILAIFTLILSFASTIYAEEQNSQNTITENLKELKDNIKESASIGAEKFQDMTSDIYTTLSDQVDTITQYAKDQKDAAIEAINTKREELKVAITEYKDASKEKTEAARLSIVEKLEHLNQEIADYNSKKK
ncbi:MAG: hypothetical protein EKK63_02970 [Acinetobacter sp.]|uniref:hypothetical protein n=1 Tax=Acinetobacter sp. TaxID=472 RepID=UPI000FB4808C|nr:hypothetical protein [Acinetobacter sp.]RUP42018.1 MAG: hypothetical protein EKK63_02970 [Acinetobacter sp.]